MIDEAQDKSKPPPAKGKSSAWGTYKLLLGACIGSLVISTIASYFYYSKWSESQDRTMLLLMEKNVLIQNYDQLKNSFDKIFTNLSVIRDENAKMILLRSSDSSKHYLCRVYWNQYTRKTFIDAVSLPATDSAMEYRLWALAGGQFMDAGVFNISVEDDIQSMKPVVSADDWAVTLEKKGTSTAQPAIENLYLVTRR